MSRDPIGDFAALVSALEAPHGMLDIPPRASCYPFVSNAPCFKVDVLGLDEYQVVAMGVDTVQVFWKSTPISSADLQAAHQAINSNLHSIRSAILSSTCGSAAAADPRLIPKDLPAKLAQLTRDGPAITITGTDALKISSTALDVVSVMNWYGGGSAAEFTGIHDSLEAYLAHGACSMSGCQSVCDALKAFVDSVPSVSPAYIDAVLIDFAHKLCYASCPCGP